MNKRKIFIAVDTDKVSRAKKIIKDTQTKKIKVGYKFGLEFFYSKDGRKFLSGLKNKIIFLDLKFNDIPNTIRSAIKSVKNLILENDLIRYEFNKNGQIISAIDKELQHDFIEKKSFGNSLVLFEDRPHGHDAWEIDIYYENMMLEEAKYKKWKPNGNGEVRNSIIFDLIIGN